MADSRKESAGYCGTGRGWEIAAPGTLHSHELFSPSENYATGQQTMTFECADVSTQS